MTLGFGPEQERFRYSVFIVLVNRLVTCAVAAGTLAWLRQPLSPAAPLGLFAVPSAANVISSSAQYEALKYVSFPVQALSKCAKSLPVMAWSWITRTRRYSGSDYASAVAVTIGCAIFVLMGDIAAPNVGVALDAGSGEGLYITSFTTIGILLLTIFMVFDGLTSTSQDKLFGSYDMHSCNQLLYTSTWSAVFSSCFLLGTNQLFPAIGFVMRHPESLGLMLGQSVVSTTVQIFIVFTIKQYGALNFALMMTLRQFLSIVFSCLVFQHHLTAAQWIGTLLVIGGLASRSFGQAARRHSGYSKISPSNLKKAFDDNVELGDVETVIPPGASSNPSSVTKSGPSSGSFAGLQKFAQSDRTSAVKSTTTSGMQSPQVKATGNFSSIVRTISGGIDMKHRPR